MGSLFASTVRRTVRRAGRFLSAAAVVLWVLGSAAGMAAIAEATPPSASVVDARARQTPEDPDPGDPGLPDPGDDGGDAGDENPPPPIPEKPAPDEPDSLSRIPAATLPSGSAPMETLGVTRRPPTAPRPGATPPPVKERNTPFGLHPIAILAVLVVGHIFLVRAVSD